MTTGAEQHETSTKPSGMSAPARAAEWRWYIYRGLAAVALGLLMAAFPVQAWLGLTVLVAAYAVVDGVLALAAARGCHGTRRWPLLLRGISGLLVGVAFLLAPALAMVSIGFVAAVLIAAWLLFTGAVEIGAAVRDRKQMTGEWLLVLYGTITIAAGVALFVLMALAPQWTFLSLTALVGVFAVITGIILLVHGFGLWRAGARAIQ